MLTIRRFLPFVLFAVLVMVVYHFRGQPVKLARLCSLSNLEDCFDLLGYSKSEMLIGSIGWWSFRGAILDSRVRNHCALGCSISVIYDQSGANACNGPCNLYSPSDPSERPIFQDGFVFQSSLTEKF